MGDSAASQSQIGLDRAQVSLNVSNRARVAAEDRPLVEPLCLLKTVIYRHQLIVPHRIGYRTALKSASLAGARQKASARCHSSAAACWSYSLGRLGSVNR